MAVEQLNHRPDVGWDFVVSDGGLWCSKGGLVVCICMCGLYAFLCWTSWSFVCFWQLYSAVGCGVVTSHGVGWVSYAMFIRGFGNVLSLMPRYNDACNSTPRLRQFCALHK